MTIPTVEQIQGWIPVLFAVTVAASALATFANAVIRSITAQGIKVAPWVLSIVAIINGLALNLDKVSQFAKMANGTPVPNTGVQTVPILGGGSIQVPVGSVAPGAVALPGGPGVQATVTLVPNDPPKGS